jgi:ABC-type nitrate/sulfonate/bicarbonate transport system substrate-binding protein
MSMTPPLDTLWYTRCPAPTAASIAIRQGWLEEEFAADGIAVRSLASATDRSIHVSHYTHSQPNAFRFGGYVPPLVSAARDTDLRVLGVSWPDRSAALLALRETGLARPEDLRGKRLSVPRRTRDSIDWWRALVMAGYRAALAKAGLDARDVEFVELDIERSYLEDATTGQEGGRSLWGARSQFAVQREEIYALMRGHVDVIYSDAAMGAVLKAFLGPAVVIDLTAPEETKDVVAAQPLILTATGSLVDSHPEIVSRWLARLLEADEWARAHEREALQIIAQDTGLPVDFVPDAYSPRIHQQLDLSLSPLRLELLRAKGEELYVGGFLARQLDFDRLVDPRPLLAARRIFESRRPPPVSAPAVHSLAHR